MIRHVPFWLDRFPKSRRPSYPRFRGEAEARVAIIGGGLTGCACAWSFAAAGIRTIVIEADRIGAGATASGPGMVREDFDASFQETASLYGLRAARVLWQGMRRASLEFAATLRRLRIRCDLAPQDLLTIALRDPDAGRRLRREYEARRAAGLDHTWMTPAAVGRSAAIAAAGAIRTRGAVVDPYRACVGLAAAAVARGAQRFEQSRVLRIRTSRKRVEIVVKGGTVRAEAVVAAVPAWPEPGQRAALTDLRALRRHLRPEHGYAVVTGSLRAEVRRELGTRAAVLRDDAEPPHVVRWLREDRVLVAGADQPPVATRAADKVLTQRTGQLMYELSTIYPAISGAMPEWSWQYAHEGTIDSLPYVGTHRNFPRHLFALGHNRHGLAVSWLAARVLLRNFLDEPAKGDELFGFSRILSS
jgi:glycine/D-amino acid oxidase-like deaminating enzyme